MSRLSKPRGKYQRLKSDSNIERSDNYEQSKIDTQKNKASHSDAIAFWRKAVQPTFRIRRGGVDEVRLKKEFRYLEIIMYEDVLSDYSLI